MPDSREIDQRIWIYVKDKESGKSAFEQIEYGTKIGNILIYDILMVEIKIPL